MTSASAPSDTAILTASELLELYRARSLSPVEATAAALQRIERDEPTVNAFCLVDTEAAMNAARASEERWQRGETLGLLDGVPCSIKDLVPARGWPTLCGSRTIDADQAWDEDALPVARMREHGAILLGKTTTPEFGWKGVTDSTLTGITRNPWNPERTPGGSSGGAAVAAALGMGALHVGSDGGGSIRMPAGFTGVFGMKPSFGRVPRYPPSSFGTLSHIGPITRSVMDAALMLTVLSLPDARDWYALPFDDRDYRDDLDAGVKGLRIGLSIDLEHATVDAEVAAAVRAAADVLSALGATVEERSPSLGEAKAVFDAHWYSGAALMLDAVDARKHDLIDPGLREIAAQGAAIPHLDYLEAARTREQLGATMCDYHRSFDALLTPTLPITAFAAGQEVADPSRQRRWVDWTPFTYPFNLTQQPAASIPCGLSSDGLPIGLQIVGPMHRDDVVLRIARAYETASPIKLPSLSNIRGPAPASRDSGQPH